MIHIWKSKKNGQWYVSHVARNGEILSSSEGFKSRASALKNIRAHMKIYGAEKVTYWDETKKDYVDLTRISLVSGCKAGGFS